jgi:N-methylhydantoinase B
MLTTDFEILTDSAGPGQWRGGSGARKSALLREAEGTVISYICDRERAVVWGISGGLPSIPHGLTLTRAGGEPEWLGAVFSDVRIDSGDHFSRPTAGGGGFGDPLLRDPVLVREDVADGYVSVARAAKDYGVVIHTIDEELAEYEINEAATVAERDRIRGERRGWLNADPEDVAARYRAGELDMIDLVRHYGVLLNWETKELLPKSTAQHREMMQKRCAAFW